MSKSNTTENNFLLLIFNATAWADLAQNDGSSPATSLYLTLHTSDPGEAGSATTNEASYTGYARVAVSRDSGGWTVSGNTASNTALAQYPQSSSSQTVTHVGITTASSGASELLYSGALDASLAVANLIQPQFAAGALDVTED